MHSGCISHNLLLFFPLYFISFLFYFSPSTLFLSYSIFSPLLYSFLILFFPLCFIPFLFYFFPSTLFLSYSIFSPLLYSFPILFFPFCFIPFLIIFLVSKTSLKTFLFKLNLKNNIDTFQYKHSKQHKYKRILYLSHSIIFPEKFIQKASENLTSSRKSPLLSRQGESGGLELPCFSGSADSH